jgi:hypothetical protein
MKIWKSKIILVFLFGLMFNFVSTAQYKAIELNADQSIYHDDNMDREYAYTSYLISPLVSYNIGYSFPVTSNFLLRSAVGLAWTKSDYYVNLPGFTFAEGDLTRHKSTTLRYINFGIGSSYWLKSDYSGLFFIGELRGHFIAKAKSETSTRLYNGTTMLFDDNGTITSDFKDDMESIVPIISVGVGYNLRIYYGLHLFANLNIDYRPTGYYKNTENITHVNRRLAIGMKYAFNRIKSKEES